MKTLIILGDGMADEPIDELGGKTPLQYADTPFMDTLARLGTTGRLKTVADGFHPGSEVANMAVLGYDLPTVYEGRGVLEAASMGVDLKPDELAMRCNLVCIEGDLLKNHSAGHIRTEEADLLIRSLNRALGSDRIRFYTGEWFGNSSGRIHVSEDSGLLRFAQGQRESEVQQKEGQGTLGEGQRHQPVDFR